MIVVPVHKCDTHIFFLGKFLCETYAPKSGADNDNMLLICHNNTPLLIAIVKKIT